MIPRRVPSILLLLTWCLLGTGLLAYLHEWQHVSHDGPCHSTPAQHDERTCLLHAQLHMPIINVGTAPLPLTFSVVGQLAPPTAHLAAQQTDIPSSCRDPPLL